MNEVNLTIRNSTAEFLIFTRQAGKERIEVRYQDETIWLTQKLMAELFGVDVRTVSGYLKNIFANNELQADSVIRKFRITAADGKNYNTKFYNLDAIISVGYRVNSRRATQFRQWATSARFWTMPAQSARKSPRTTRRSSLRNTALFRTVCLSRILIKRFGNWSGNWVRRKRVGMGRRVKMWLRACKTQEDKCMLRSNQCRAGGPNSSRSQ